MSEHNFSWETQPMTARRNDPCVVSDIRGGYENEDSFSLTIFGHPTDCMAKVFEVGNAIFKDGGKPWHISYAIYKSRPTVDSVGVMHATVRLKNG